MPTTDPRRRALNLEYVTIGWNTGEFVVTVVLGILARSLALVAFGLDAVIEIFASMVIVWHLREVDPAPNALARTHRRIGIAFFALAVSLGVGAAISAASRHVPDESVFGIAYLVAAALAMLGLALAKRKLAIALDDGPLASEANVTFLDAALATSILLALVANMVAGWWWADAAATFLVAAVAMREGFESFAEAREVGS